MKWMRRAVRPAEVIPDVVSVYDSHAAERHLEAVYPVRKSVLLQSVAPKATPVEVRRLIPERHAYMLKDVNVEIEEGIVRTPEGSLIAETLPSHYRFIKMLRAGAYTTARASGDISEEVDVCTSLGGGKYFGNHYHRWVDEIPRLQGLDSVGDVSSVTVPSSYPRASTEIIKHLVSPEIEVRKARDRTHRIHAKRFLFLPASTLDYCGYLPPAYLEKFREALASFAGRNEARAADRKVYISRSNSTKRRILNEPALIRLVKRRGFEVVKAEDLDLDAQIDLFREVRFIVGAHGAGLTNMMFSTNCTIVELFPGAPFTHYRWLAESLGHEYRNVVGDPAKGKHADFEVDLSVLEKALDEK